VAKPLPIAQIRKAKPEVVAEIDRLLDQHCDREVAEILNRQGRRTWQNAPFNLKKIAHIRQAFHLKCRYSRLRAKGLLTAKEMSAQHGVTTTTINLWAREGRLQKHHYDNAAAVYTSRWKRARFTKAMEADGPSSRFSPLHRWDEMQYET
jgi:hypothetical protein